MFRSRHSAKFAWCTIAEKYKLQLIENKLSEKHQLSEISGENCVHRTSCRPSFKRHTTVGEKRIQEGIKS